MKVTEFFESSDGDIYSISLSSENGGLIADDIRLNMEKEGIVVEEKEENVCARISPPFIFSYV